MDTVIVSNSQFYSHFPRRIPQGTVNAEAVLIRLDSEWDNLTVRIHWLNVPSNVERKPLLERDQPNTIPWEVLTDLGELRMGLVGLDGETVIKPTIWLTYGYVSDGVDPESGSDPQPPTPSWEQQMVEQARVAAEAAKEAKDAAVNAEKAASQSGPYADAAKEAAEEAKEAQRAASTSAQEAGNAKDQANTASNTAKDHADAAGAAKEAAERAAETAGKAQSDASQSAKSAANSAQAAERAKQEAQNAAAALPAPSQEFAGKVPMVNPEGTGYIFGEAGGGKIDDTTLGRDTTWSSLKIVDSLAPSFEVSGPVVTCNPVPGYPLSVVSQIVPFQDGEGDPSPDNVRPIVGRDASNLLHRGKNLFNISGDINRNYLGDPDRDYNLVDEGVLTANADSSGRHLVGQVVNVKKGTPVIFSFDMLDAGTGISGYVGIYEIGIASIRTIVQPKTPGHYVSSEYVPENDTILFAFGTAGGTGAKYKNISLTFKDEGGEYEPYKGLAHIATFGDTVYGGQLNWVTGVLTVDRVCLSLTGGENFVNATASDGVTRFFALKNLNPAAMGIYNPGGTGEIYNMVVNKSPYDNADENIAQIVSLAKVNELRIRLSSGLDDVEKFKAELARLNEAGTPFQVSYKIAEPFTVQLTPTEILALSGVNTLYTNTGDTTVVGRADPSATIKALLSRIDALEKAAIGGV